MPNSLQLGLAPCSSRHHSCASVGPCPRPEVRGQERLLVGGPDRSSSSGSQGGARRTSAWWRIPGRPLPWLSPLIPVPPCFRGSPSVRGIPQLLELLVCRNQALHSWSPRVVAHALPKAQPPGPGGGTKHCSQPLQVTGLSLDSTHHRHFLSTPLCPWPLPHHQHCPSTKPAGQCLLLGASF